jgi:hypothetical protein
VLFGGEVTNGRLWCAFLGRWLAVAILSISNRPDMSPYEAQAWASLGEYWQHKADRRSLPPRAEKAREAATAKVREAASATGGFIVDVTPQPLKHAGGVVLDRALEPTLQAVVGLLEWVTETVQRISDPEGIYKYHLGQGRPVTTLYHLRTLELEHLDEFTRWFVWRCRTTGVVEGAALGLVTFIPVAGSVAAVGLDLIIMHALSTAIATRAAHAYGLDPTSDAGRAHLDRMLREAWTAQAPKARVVKGAKDAFVEGAARVHWSEKFRNDHRIAAAVESLMKQIGNGQHVPIDKVVAKMPAIGVVTSAGINGTVLGSLAKNSVRYSQTIHLADKHNLPLPPNLT